VVGVQDDRLEGALAQPAGSQPRVTAHRPWPVPRLAEVQLYYGAEDHAQQLDEIRRDRGVRQVVALALDDVGREPGRRRQEDLFGAEADVPHKQAADDRVLPRADRGAPVAADAGPHPLHGGAPLAWPKNSHASETFSRAESLKNPPPTTLLCG
jgi:hypothetical protein